MIVTTVCYPLCGSENELQLHAPMKDKSHQGGQKKQDTECTVWFQWYEIEKQADLNSVLLRDGYINVIKLQRQQRND
jgi:hypothetical protein